MQGQQLAVPAAGSIQAHCGTRSLFASALKQLCADNQVHLIAVYGQPVDFAPKTSSVRSRSVLQGASLGASCGTLSSKQQLWFRPSTPERSNICYQQL
jgi:hypothetical protein